VFRLNIGVGRATFERLVGGRSEHDFAQLDTVLPHPVYAKQLWVSVLNPSAETFQEIVRPLLDEAHQRVAARLRRRRASGAAEVPDGNEADG
jgi:hypothetical protein